MPSPKRLFLTHRFRGGWATDFGPTVYTSPQQGIIQIPFLTDAKNVIYELNGGVRTMPGTIKVNSSTLGASNVVTGIYDYWRQGVSGSPIQKLVAHVDTRVVACSLSDGIFSNIGTGLTNGAIPSYSTFDDLLIIASDGDVPKSWDQSTFQNLAGSPPNFTFSTSHANRQWAAGVAANPSRLYYSGSLDPEDWTGGTSGSIDIDPSDGDSIVGLASFRDELIVFKGPYKGSIHRISGTSPSTFARAVLMRGVTAAYQNSIFTLPSDIGFISPRGTVHSLVATQRFGDYEQSSVSFPINRELKNNYNQTYYKNWWAVEDQPNGMVYFAMTPAGQTRNTELLMMDYRFLGLGESYPRWAKWTAFGADSLAMVVDTGNKLRPFFGLNDGFVYKGEQGTRTHNNSALSPVITTPFFSYSIDYMGKTLTAVGVELAPKNANSFTVSWTRDGQTQQSDTGFAQGGSDVLGTWASGQFTLGTSTLGGTRYLTRYREQEEGGEFRTIQYQITDTTNNSELEVHGLLANIEPGAMSTQDSLS